MSKLKILLMTAIFTMMIAAVACAGDREYAVEEFALRYTVSNGAFVDIVPKKTTAGEVAELFGEDFERSDFHEGVIFTVKMEYPSGVKIWLRGSDDKDFSEFGVIGYDVAGVAGLMIPCGIMVGSTVDELFEKLGEGQPFTDYKGKTMYIYEKMPYQLAVEHKDGKIVNFSLGCES